jgi:hypothetical protein
MFLLNYHNKITSNKNQLYKILKFSKIMKIKKINHRKNKILYLKELILLVTSHLFKWEIR